MAGQRREDGGGAHCALTHQQKVDQLRGELEAREEAGRNHMPTRCYVCQGIDEDTGPIQGLPNGEWMHTYHPYPPELLSLL